MNQVQRLKLLCLKDTLEATIKAKYRHASLDHQSVHVCLYNVRCMLEDEDISATRQKVERYARSYRNSRQDIQIYAWFTNQLQKIESATEPRETPRFQFTAGQLEQIDGLLIELKADKQAANDDMYRVYRHMYTLLDYIKDSRNRYAALQWIDYTRHKNAQNEEQAQAFIKYHDRVRMVFYGK